MTGIHFEPPTLTPLGRIRVRRCWGPRLLLGILLAHAAIAFSGAVMVGQSSPERILIDGLTAKIETMERQRIDARMSVLESDMYEVKWLGRGIAATYLTHLVMSSLLAKKKEDAP